jgi:glycosyltransferase involved in cell wall biosynthesis
LELRIAGVGKLRDYLLTLAKEIGLGDRLNLYGLVEEIPNFLQDLDVFVLSSDSEQHPNALNEAMACGLACVATRVGCVNELLDEGRCGKIVSPGDRVGMAAAIRELVEAPTTRQHYGALAKCQARDHYSLNQMLAAYDALYRGCSGHKDPVS